MNNTTCRVWTACFITVILLNTYPFLYLIYDLIQQLSYPDKFIPIIFDTWYITSGEFYYISKFIIAWIIYFNVTILPIIMLVLYLRYVFFPRLKYLSLSRLYVLLLLIPIINCYFLIYICFDKKQLSKI